MLFNYRKTNAITTTIAVPVRSRSPTTATTAPATAPVLELSVDSTAARVTFTATITVEENNKLAELCHGFDCKSQSSYSFKKDLNY